MKSTKKKEKQGDVKEIPEGECIYGLPGVDGKYSIDAKDHKKITEWLLKHHHLNGDEPPMAHGPDHWKTINHDKVYGGKGTRMEKWQLKFQEEHTIGCVMDKMLHRIHDADSKFVLG